MRFSSAVDALVQENQYLRMSVKIMGFGIATLSLTVLFLHERDPVVIERSSRGLEMVHVTPLLRSEADLETALRLMVEARFDSGFLGAETFLSQKQKELRDAEQKELKSRGLEQRVIYRSSMIDKKEASVEFDRVLSVGDVRSALKTKVKVAFEEVTPTEVNPYGLRLAMATPIDPVTDKPKKEGP